MLFYLNLNLVVDNTLLNHIFVRDTAEIPDINITKPTSSVKSSELYTNVPGTSMQINNNFLSFFIKSI